MKNIIISNIPDEMYAHMVNGFAGNGTAYQDLTAEEQQTLLGAKLFAYVTEVAGANAINAAREQAAAQVGALVEQMVAATKETVAVTVEEVAT